MLAKNSDNMTTKIIMNHTINSNLHRVHFVFFFLQHRVTVRPEVVEFLCNGAIYCKVCSSIFPGKNILMGHRLVIQTLSRNGIYVVEDGDIAVTETALQQKKPFRKVSSPQSLAISTDGRYTELVFQTSSPEVRRTSL